MAVAAARPRTSLHTTEQARRPGHGDGTGRCGGEIVCWGCWQGVPVERGLARWSKSHWFSPAGCGAPPAMGSGQPNARGALRGAGLACGVWRHWGERVVCGGWCMVCGPPKPPREWSVCRAVGEHLLCLSSDTLPSSLCPQPPAASSSREMKCPDTWAVNASRKGGKPRCPCHVPRFCWLPFAEIRSETIRS